MSLLEVIIVKFIKLFPKYSLIMSKEGDKWYDGTGSLIDNALI